MKLTALCRTVTVLTLICAPALLTAFQTSQTAPAAVHPHPLDPLTAAEIDAAAAVLSAAPQFPAAALFATCR